MPKQSTPATGPGIELPEVHTVVMPDGARLSMDEAAKNSAIQQEAARASARQEAQRKAKRIGKFVEFNESFADADDEKRWDFCVEVWDEKFFLRDPDDDTQKFTVLWRGETAKKMGVVAAKLEDEEFLRNGITGDQQVIMVDESTEYQKRVLGFCLVKTSIEGSDFIGENVTKLPRRVREALVLWAQEGANLSDDEAQFPGANDPIAV